MKLLCCTIGLLLVGGAVLAEEPAMVPFVVDWSSAPDSPASVAMLLDSPAGKAGFIRAAAGHLVRPDGQRFRIWGVNATGKAGLPSQEDAPKVAAHLAQRGLNCVRFHFLDAYSPRGLVDPHRSDTRTLDPAMLDRLDFFIAQLKGRGIYSDLNLNVARAYKPGDGVADCELLGFAKALTYFDPRLIELQKDYARRLLTHLNPYTHNEYRNEPAVALVEMVNENSIVESWFSGRLLGQNTRKHPGTWTDIPASYEKSLTELYNRWLTEHVAPDVLARLRAEAGVGQAALPRLQPKEFAQASPERFHTEAAFYMDLEQRFFADMGRFLREELQVKSLLLGTADHNHSRSGYPLLTSTSQLDIVDGHDYWQHPSYVTDPATGKTLGFKIPNTPMVNDPLHSTVVDVSRSAIAGKPYTVSELNHPFPHEYACEGIPIMAAYAALQDWDGVFWYTLEHDDVASTHTRRSSYFEIAPDPVKMAQMAAGALVFLRGDVRPARRVIERSYSAEQVRESVRMPWSERPYFTPGFPLELTLIYGMRIGSLAGPEMKYDPVSVDPLRSDTGEILWLGAAAKQGLVVVDTARSQALVGFCKANRAQSRNLVSAVDGEFCALTLSALDNASIARSKRLLLTAGARVANSGMRWNASRKTLDDWGKPPVCIEPVTGSVCLRGLADVVVGVSVQALDGAGHPLGPAVAATKSAAGWDVKLGTPATTWYLLSVIRNDW